MKAILELKESAAWWFFKEKNSKCVKVEPKINFRLQLVPCLCEVVVLFMFYCFDSGPSGQSLSVGRPLADQTHKQVSLLSIPPLKRIIIRVRKKQKTQKNQKS